MPADAKEAIRFSNSVGTSSTVTETYETQADATVETLTVRIYRGAELDLQVKPFLKAGDSDSRRRIPLVQYRGKSYVDGDGDKWEFDISESVVEGDILGVEVENKSGSYSYDYAVHMSLDRSGGTARFGGLVERFQSAVGGFF